MDLNDPDFEEYKEAQKRYNRQEALKREGHEEAHDESRSPHGRMIGALKVMTGHFERSRAAWGDKKPAHGDWYTYGRSWVWSMRDGFWDEEVMVLLRKAFPAPDKPMIRKGYSYWGGIKA